MRSCFGPSGQTVRYYERPKPGQPGVFERWYIDTVDRFSSPVGTIKLVRPGERRHPSMTCSFSSSKEPTVRMMRSGFEDLWASLPPRDLEVGGGLFGKVKDGVVTIYEATYAVRERHRDRCVLDKHKILARLKEHRDAGDGLVLVGHWHREPGAGDSRPSRTDIESWVSWLRANREPWFVGMTVRRPHKYFLGWKDASVRAHLFTRAAAGVDCVKVMDLKQHAWTL